MEENKRLKEMLYPGILVNVPSKVVSNLPMQGNGSSAVAVKTS